MLALKDYLPDFKGALSSFYDEKIKPTLESKSTEYKDLLKENFARGANTQKAIVAILLAVFLLLALNFFWVDKPNGIQWKYALLGFLISYTMLYVIDLKPQEFAQKILENN
jgi:hypothetical protein